VTEPSIGSGGGSGNDDGAPAGNAPMGGATPAPAATPAPPAAAPATRELAPGEPALLALAILLSAAMAAAIYLPLDEDAFIYYRYALNWAGGRGLAFNPGDPVEGWSSPLWMGLSGLLAWLGCKLPVAVPLLGIACGAATVGAVWRLARRAGLDRFGRLASAFALTFSYPFLLWSRSGLETPLYALLLVVAAELYLAAEYPRPADEARRRRLQLAGGATLALVALARPEGALLMAIVAADRLADRRDWRGAARYLVPAVAGYGSYLLWRLSAMGTLTPNTSIKLYPLRLHRSTKQLFGYLVLIGALPPLLPLWALLDRRTPALDRRRLAFLVSAVALLSVAFQLLAGGDYRTDFRFLVPSLPLLLVAVWLAASRIQVERWRARRPFAPLPVRLLLLGLLLSGSLELLSLYLPTARQLPRLGTLWRDAYAAEPDDFRVDIARWVGEHVPNGSVVAFGQMGRVPYLATASGRDLRFFDTLGLVDRQVAAIYRFDHKLAALARELAAGRPFAEAVERGRRERAARFAAVLAARRPDFIIVETYLENYEAMMAIMEQPAFAARYREVAQIPAGLRGKLPVRIYALRQPRSPGQPRPPGYGTAGGAGGLAGGGRAEAGAGAGGARWRSKKSAVAL
jgi:arabinofuranosyltransferase